MVFGILTAALGLGVICTLLYYYAVFALPVFVGLSAAFWAMNSGAGAGSIVVGFIVGVVMFIIGQIVFRFTRSVVLRWTIALLFAGPAAFAGYSMVLELSALGSSSVIWQHAFALIGAGVIGSVVVTRLDCCVNGLSHSRTTFRRPV